MRRLDCYFQEAKPDFRDMKYVFVPENLVLFVTEGISYFVCGKKEEERMRIYETANYEEMSRKAANILSAQVILKPDSVLGLATGSTPIGTYDQLVEWDEKGDLDFSEGRR